MSSGASVGAGCAVPAGFAAALIAWQRVHGRHGLPWQSTRDPYVVWLSEVMLQQTQVSTVLTYFPRFLLRFPDVRALASASTDEVMALWSGLGYYSRARNLHRCAQMVVTEHGGEFPRFASALATLPGIGESTAAAIAAFCHGEKISIVDGNVRRVLSRLLAYSGDLSMASAQKELSLLAQALVPKTTFGDDMSAYTQGLMDLGATVCTRSRPLCERCPVSELCRARAAGIAEQFPVKTRKTKRRHETWWLLLAKRVLRSGQIQWWLLRRPARGIWAGLYCAPVFESEVRLMDTLDAAQREEVQLLEPVSHSLTHRELRLQPLLLEIAEPCAAVPAGEGQWVSERDLHAHGMPAPLRALLMAQAQQPAAPVQGAAPAR
ncbi:A/G-specific adenine glycosylase [Hydrogenophaga sp.]|uniref:A/G-specific adenine glycosylase n=1 Tax=Hydrogenophaga sp. TaxID=1904254 RepID=UPI0027170736|nr:A/G-specific adenine glycosylase [Hydrogenophaga sp.]MDO8905385.1 A/G-specific adenine glycosylase [Hydrogenophaga sp.]